MALARGVRSQESPSLPCSPLISISRWHRRCQLSGTAFRALLAVPNYYCWCAWAHDRPSPLGAMTCPCRGVAQRGAALGPDQGRPHSRGGREGGSSPLASPSASPTQHFSLLLAVPPSPHPSACPRREDKHPKPAADKSVSARLRSQEDTVCPLAA